MKSIIFTILLFLNLHAGIYSDDLNEISGGNFFEKTNYSENSTYDFEERKEPEIAEKPKKRTQLPDNKVNINSFNNDELSSQAEKIEDRNSNIQNKKQTKSDLMKQIKESGYKQESMMNKRLETIDDIKPDNSLKEDTETNIKSFSGNIKNNMGFMNGVNAEINNKLRNLK